ncbi:EARP and GARP complex-interacting protein 1 isoform X1 [Prionailurus viverrinus]|uniref:EARP and GARP complex-interacting protein 1 isoform X1 n=1 Tax=Prionailurus viverrinus TaxID=61388 RepID=UPI001FF643A8|nr:EARP and GARP complex-interacting protein 1 isoform X1 [Prionailurus viverrinus]
MEDDAPVIYGLEFQARALTPQTAETDAIRFLVGTQSLKYDNQIHIIDFDDENNIISKNVLLHQVGEIWHISASPADKGVLATCYNKPSDSKVLTCAAVWRMPKELEPGSHESPDDSSSPAHTLELLCHLDDTAHGSVACVVWEPTGDGRRVISLADSHILLWDLQESSSQAVYLSLAWNGSDPLTLCQERINRLHLLPMKAEQRPHLGCCKLAGSASLEGKGQLKFTSGRWSPHHTCTQVATANDTTIRGWDTRSMSQIYCIENAHGQLVRDLDFNPNKQYYLASCGDDCRVKFWDTRNVTEPVKTLEEHSHWVWSVRYNHSHDQLVLTGSSDSRVILSNMVSISSEPFGHLVDDDDLSDQEERRPEEKSQEPPQDSVIATYEEHEDSVYAVDWSSADPWLFASLSYDGRLVINRVPRALKYHILL